MIRSDFLGLLAPFLNAKFSRSKQDQNGLLVEPVELVCTLCDPQRTSRNLNKLYNILRSENVLYTDSGTDSGTDSTEEPTGTYRIC